MFFVKEPPKGVLGKIARVLGAGVSTGLRILAPLLILAYLYRLVAGPARSALKGVAVWLGDLVGLKPAITGSSPVCLALAVLIFLALGALFYTPPGRFVIGLIDRGLCKLKLYHSLRGLVKLPKIGKVDPDKPAEGRVVWAWQPGGWATGVVRDEIHYPETGVTMLTVLFLGAPLPTSWNVARINAEWTADAGATAGAWTSWNEKGGGPLPEDGKEAPSSPPAAFLRSSC